MKRLTIMEFCFYIWLFAVLCTAFARADEMELYKAHTYPNHPTIGKCDHAYCSQESFDAAVAEGKPWDSSRGCAPVTAEQVEFCQASPASLLRLMGLEDEDECIHPDGQLYQTHWLACGETVALEQAKNLAAAETITQWSARALLAESALAQCQAELNPPPVGFEDCFQYQRPELWKPVSDNTGWPVFLLPESERELEWRALDSEGSEVVDVTFRTCCPNGNRAHWDVRAKCQSLPKPLYLFASDNTCRIVPDPCERYE